MNSKGSTITSCFPLDSHRLWGPLPAQLSAGPSTTLAGPSSPLLSFQECPLFLFASCCWSPRPFTLTPLQQTGSPTTWGPVLPACLLALHPSALPSPVFAATRFPQCPLPCPGLGHVCLLLRPLHALFFLGILIQALMCTDTGSSHTGISCPSGQALPWTQMMDTNKSKRAPTHPGKGNVSL